LATFRDYNLAKTKSRIYLLLRWIHLNIRLSVKLAVLVSVTLFATAYTGSAYWAAASVHEWEGRLWWPSMPGGSFYPWPHPPLGIQGMLITQLNELDSWYYSYVIRSGVLLYSILFLWALVFWRVWRILKRARSGAKNNRVAL